MSTTGVGASTDYPNTIIIDGTVSKGKSNYEFEVSGSVRSHPDIGSAEVKDIIDGGNVTGAVHRDKDAYQFSGEIVYLDVKGDAGISLKYGDEEDVAADRLEIIASSEGSVDYTFDATDRITKVLDNGANSAEESEDTVTENSDGTWTATGSTANGSGDTYDFWGDLTHFEPVTGEFTLFFNGTETTVTELTGQEPPEPTYPLTIDDFEEGVRSEWSNTSNHATTSDFARSGSHAAYRASGSSLYDDGTGFADTVQDGGRFVSWSFYVDQMGDWTSSRLGFNGDGPPAPDNFSEWFVDFANDEVLLRESVDGATEVRKRTATEPLSAGEWYEIIAWWNHDILECWVYDSTETEVGHLRATGQTNYGDHWWILDGESGTSTGFDDVRFHETHPYTGRHYTEDPSATDEPPETGLHVAPDGSDSNDGSYDNPWGTVLHALDELGSMDASGLTLHVHEGTYDESASSSQYIGIAGSESDPAQILGYGDAVVNLSGVDSGEWGAAIILYGCEHLTVEGFTFEESAGYGLRTEGACVGLTIRDCVARHNGLSGFYMNPYGDIPEGAVVVEGCESYANYHGSNHADGFAVGPDHEYKSVVFRRCAAHHNEDDGFDTHFANGDTFVRCQSYRNGFTLEEELWNPDNPDGDGWKCGGPDSASGPIYLYECIAWDNYQFAFLMNSNPYACTFYNCTVYKEASDTSSAAHWAEWSQSGQHELRNCLSFHKDGNHLNNPDEFDDQYNNWNLGVTDPEVQTKDTTSDLFAHLTSGSAARDAGVDVGREFGGDAPDLGAYEYALDTEQLL